MKNDVHAVHKSIRPLLQKIGLDEKQIEVYLALLSLKSAKASDVAKLAKQSRSHTYIILRTLEEMGLVSEVKEHTTLQFIAEPPERLLTYLQNQERQYRDLQTLVEGAMPVLSSLTSAYVGSPRVTVLKGLEGTKQVYRDAFVHEFLGIYNAQTTYDAFGKNIVNILFGTTPTLRGRDLLVHNQGAQQYCNDTSIHTDYSIRLLPKEVTFETDTLVYGDNVTLFAFDDERTIVRIENRNIANAFRAWFEVMWKVSKDV